MDSTLSETTVFYLFSCRALEERRAMVRDNVCRKPKPRTTRAVPAMIAYRPVGPSHARRSYHLLPKKYPSRM